jgi:hypothetical protein
MKKKVKRYQEGGEAEEKRRGLKASEGERVGFLERLRMGNIDDPTSEAYKRFGAGRGAAMVRGNTEDDAASLEKTGGFGASAVAEAAKRPTYRSSTEGQVDERDRRQEAQASTPKKQSFGQAFAEARKAGDKTFMFGGKKYTTELAKPSAKSTKNEGQSTQDMDLLEAAKTAARRRDERTKDMQEQDAKAAARRAQEMAEQRKKDTSPKPTGKFLNTGYKEFERIRQEGRERRAAAKENERKQGMKSGGMVKSSVSKRADGCAVRGKTRGRIV